MKPRYSGPLSVRFWDRVGLLKRSDRSSIYTAGVILQDIEAKVLRWLEEAESAAGITPPDKALRDLRSKPKTRPATDRKKGR